MTLNKNVMGAFVNKVGLYQARLEPETTALQVMCMLHSGKEML